MHLDALSEIFPGVKVLVFATLNSLRELTKNDQFLAEILVKLLQEFGNRCAYGSEIYYMMYRRDFVQSGFM